MVEQEYLESLGFVKDRSDSCCDYYVGFMLRTHYNPDNGKRFDVNDPVKIYYDRINGVYSFYKQFGYRRFESIIGDIGGDCNEFKLYKRIGTIKQILEND